MYRLLILPLLLLSLAAHAQSGLSVSPARLFFHSNASRHTQQITLTNTVNAPVRWVISLQDWDRDTLGRKNFYPPGSRPQSCAAALQIIPNEVEIPAGGMATVSVSLKNDVPAASGHAMIMINEAPENEALRKGEQRQASISVKAAFAIHVYLVNDTASRRLEIEDFRYNAAAGRQLELSIRNNGGQPLDTRISITVTDRASNREWKLPDVSSATLPGAYRTSLFHLPEEIPAGSYLVIGTADSGDDLPLKVAELSLDLP